MVFDIRIQIDAVLQHCSGNMNPLYMALNGDLDDPDFLEARDLGARPALTEHQREDFMSNLNEKLIIYLADLRMMEAQINPDLPFYPGLQDLRRLVDGNWDDQVTLPGDDESKDRVRLVIEQSTRLSDILYD